MLSPFSEFLSSKFSSRVLVIPSKIRSPKSNVESEFVEGESFTPFRGWKVRLGEPKAITAMAHKLARVLWHLLKFKQAFDWNVSVRH